jgi:H+/Cl- antiporter ClcA
MEGSRNLAEKDMVGRDTVRLLRSLAHSLLLTSGMTGGKEGPFLH